MRISDWSSDVCSSDLGATQLYQCLFRDEQIPFGIEHFKVICDALAVARTGKIGDGSLCLGGANLRGDLFGEPTTPRKGIRDFAESSLNRSEEHTSELQSLMRISYAVFCLKKKKKSQCTQRHNVAKQ